MAPALAALPIPPRIASGVPAAIPHAPATTITEIVGRASRVIKNVKPRIPGQNGRGIQQSIRSALNGRPRTFRPLDSVKNAPEGRIAADFLRTDF
jgi:hypothetical protein